MCFSFHLRLFLTVFFSFPSILFADPRSIVQHVCEKAQIEVESLDAIVPLRIKVEEFVDFDSFVYSKAAVGDDTLFVRSYQYLNDLHYPDQIFCKFKTQESIARLLGVAISGAPKDCNSINEILFNQSLDHIDSETLQRFHNSKLNVVFSRDQEVEKGPIWIETHISIDLVDQNILRVRSASLRTPDFIPRFGGARYCKVLHPIAISSIISRVIQGNE